MQDAEYGEVKKKRREDRMVVRKREQRAYEEESVRLLTVSVGLGLGRADLLVQMRTRHSNLLAMARFLKTKTEPKLVSRMSSCPSSIPMVVELTCLVSAVLQTVGTTA